MTGVRDIQRHDLDEGAQTLHLADEVNHLAWIRADVTNRAEPFRHPCDICGEWHEWRRVWVKA